VNTNARPIVTGTTFAMVWPTISMTSIGKLDMTASRDREF